MIKKISVIMILTIGCLETMAQLDAQERFFLLNYLVLGKRTGHFLRPTKTHKGNCSFEYVCRPDGPRPLSEEMRNLPRYWSTPILTYALADSLRFYDSLFFRTYEYYDEKNQAAAGGVALAPYYNKIPHTTEEDRLTSVQYILPYYVEYKYIKDTTELILTYKPGYSPERSPLYTANLGYLIYDYVYRKRRVPTVITYKENGFIYRNILKNLDLDAEMRKHRQAK